MKRLRMNRRTDAAVRKLRPNPASFKRTIGVFRQHDGDIVFVLDAPPGEGEGDIYATVPAEVACAIRADLGDMLNCDDGGASRPVVPLGEVLGCAYRRGDMLRDQLGNVVVNVGMPGGDLLLRLRPADARAVLSDLAERLGVKLVQRA